VEKIVLLPQTSACRLRCVDLQHAKQLTHRARTHTIVEVGSVSDL
jgi:hypothetical protein